MGETIIKQGIILGGGEILNYSAVASLIGPEDPIFCADSGYYHCVPLQVKPSLLVGDFDSLKELPEGVPKVSLPEDKNYTDTTFAIQGAIHQGCNQLILAGMLGGRLDHTLANLQALVYCTNQGINTFITDGETQVFCLVAKKGEPQTALLSPLENYYFSLLSYSEKSTGVTIQGGKYELENHTLTFDLARGLSNEFVEGQEVSIHVREGTLFLLLVPKTDK